MSVSKGAVQRSEAAIARAIESVMAWGELVEFFPKGDLATQMIADEVVSFLQTIEHLPWFEREVVRRMPKWGSVPMLRAIYTTRYRPGDGYEVDVVTTPGLTAEDLEAQFRRREMDENDRRLEAYRREALLAPPEDREPFQLPEVKRLPCVHGIVTGVCEECEKPTGRPN